MRKKLVGYKYKAWELKTTGRFFSKVIKTDSCWNWTGPKDSDGYGDFRLNHRHIRAHRWSYEFHKSTTIDPNMCVLHRCDRPSCVNPAHLFIGTNLENAIDRKSKGRYRNSELHPCAKLSDSDVRDIRRRLSNGEFANMVAKAFNVSATTIQKIDRGETWRYVE